MSRKFRLAVILVLVLPLCGLPAQVENKKETSGRNQAEMRFVDGSTVRMDLLQESLEVITKYGKLTIPAGDIRHIEFGLHLSDEANRKVQDAIAHLGSRVHAEREGASRELVLLGYEAFPALQTAVKSPDKEVARRAEEAIKAIRDKVPAHLLRVDANDRIETAEFPVVGRISSPTIKAKSAYFGEKEIKIGDLYTLYAFGAGGQYEVTIDAARYGSAANQWMDTGIDVGAHAGLSITASGQVDLQGGNGQVVTGPAGMGVGGVAGGAFVAGAGGRAVRNANLTGGSLLGRVGEGSDSFVIGEAYKSKAMRHGRLYLHISPSPWGIQSIGSYKVKITVGGLP